MAELKPEDGPILKGSILPVTIEDVIADVLVVCLEHGAKIYKGILLDSTKRDLPYGIGFDKFRLEQEKQEISASQTAYVDPNAGGSAGLLSTGTGRPEVTALSSRYTYSQDPNATDPRLLPPPRRTLVKPIRDGKNVRNMRLRPRKVLCSNCNQGVHDNKVEGNTTSVDSTTCQTPQTQNQLCEKSVPSQRPAIRMSFPPRPTLRMSLRGKRKVEETVEVDLPTPKRPRQESVMSKVISRANPVIKISFTSPQGEVHTSKLQTSRTTNADETESELSPQQDPEEQECYDYRYKRLRKALKRARIKGRSWDESCASEVTTTVPDENSIRHHKKSKRNKHKRKHRHRNLIQSPVHDPNSNQNDTSDFENDAANAGTQPQVSEDVEKKGKDVEDWEGYHVYHEPSHPKETSHFKENSINVPRQQPTPTRPFHSPHDLAHGDDPQTMAAAARSPYTNRSSCANSQIGSISPSSNFDTDEEGDMPPAGDEFPVNESEELEEARLRPLMMRIQTKTVTTGSLPDGRNVRVGEVVWGKIHGFPWWPGKILSITVSQRDNGTVITQMAHIAWCGSSTMSHMPCSELYPFLEDFKNRYNKKKKGPYKNAIKEATRIAHSLLTSQTAIGTPSPSVEGDPLVVEGAGT